MLETKQKEKLMTNVIDFLNASGEFMAKDRPDVFHTAADASAYLADVMEHMRESDSSTWTAFASYVLYMQLEDGVEEWFLTRRVATVATFFEEQETQVYGHTKGSGVFSVNVNLPDVLDDVDSL